jgi:Family of unknown function (DUF5750)
VLGMEVIIVDYGYSLKSGNYFVLYEVSNIDEETQNKIIERVEEETCVKSGKLYITEFFDVQYFPFGSSEAKLKIEDFIAREEIEMLAFLSSILED